MARNYVKKQDSALVFILKGLMVPYSEANIMLSFKPRLFFSELEKTTHYKKRTLENALYRAYKEKLIEKNGAVIDLTEEGERIVGPFVPQVLPKGARLMVIFDIPEDMATIRAKFRRVLKCWNFRQVQKSVWVTPYDHKNNIKEVITEFNLGDYIELYECSPA
jgi:FPC/CPF motif-containing protein YcgG